MTILLAISISATKALEFFTLPSGCPELVPDEYIFCGNPTGKVLRLTPEACSAAYAAISGWFERGVYWSELTDDDIRNHGGIDPKTGEWVVHPMSWWFKNGELDSLPGCVGADGLNHPSNRIVKGRLEAGGHIDDIILQLRNGIKFGVGFDHYSSLLPRKETHNTSWSTNIFEALGVDDRQDLSSHRWPVYSILTNDWLLSQTNFPNQLNSPTARLLDEVTIGNILTKSTNRFVDVFENFKMSDDRAQALTNRSRRLDFDKMSAANITIAATDLNYVFDDLPKFKYVDEYGDLTEDHGYAWRKVRTTEFIDSRYIVDCTYNLLSRKLEFANVTPSGPGRTSVTNSVLIDKDDYEGWIYFDDVKGIFNANGTLHATVYLDVIPLRHAIEPLVNGKRYKVLFSIPDNFSRYVDVNIWDVDLGMQAGYFTTEPDSFSGIVNVSIDYWFFLLKSYPASLVGNYEYENYSWPYDLGLVENVECAFFSWLRFGLDNERLGYGKNSWDFTGHLCCCENNIKNPFNDLGVFYRGAQLDLFGMADAMIEKKLAGIQNHDDMPFSGRNLDKKLEDFLKDPLCTSFPPGTAGVADILIKDEQIYYVDGSNEYTFAKIAIGGVELNLDGISEGWTNYSWRIKGNCPAILTEKWKFPNMSIDMENQDKTNSEP